jgi:hypothetical protein
MFRTTLLLATLCVLAACDKTSTPTAPRTGPVVVDPGTGPGPSQIQTVRGMLRRTMIDSVEFEWNLELGDGTLHKLIGGPVETYEALLDKQVFITAVALDDGSFSVQNLEEDTQIYEEFRHRLRAKK